MPTSFEIRNGRVVEVNTTARTIDKPALRAGWTFAESLPRAASRGEYWVTLNGYDYGSGNTYGTVVWILNRVPVLKMRDKPGRGVPLIPSDASLEAGFTPPLVVTEFRQPLPGEAHVSRRYKNGHEFARVQMCDTARESAERADGRWIVAPATEYVAPAPRRAARRPDVVLSAEAADAIEARMVNAGLNLNDARRILGR